MFKEMQIVMVPTKSLWEQGICRGLDICFKSPCAPAYIIGVS